uniref:UTP--glucose-1-phosphate uridylyltransferase n=1 Tax=Latimeria chalumnae TaxID=7897 RepID=H3AA09_LATCH
IETYESVKSWTLPNDVSSLLKKLVVLKLNEGLGNDLGCKGPKSLICVRNESTLLDLTVQQIENLNNLHRSDIPLVLMNSSDTQEATKKILQEYAHSTVHIHTFNQSSYPWVNKESMHSKAEGWSTSKKETEKWCPPRHCDIYTSFCHSGLLQQFLSEGKKYVFISNGDNIGATIDLHILNYLLNHTINGKHCEFLVEVIDKIHADLKDRKLIQDEKKLKDTQVPKVHMEDFTVAPEFKFFNTSNLWISLEALQRVHERETVQAPSLGDSVAINQGKNEIQLKKAIGMSIKSFDNAVGINVPHTRFLPINTTSDLLLVMSNLYCLEQGCLHLNEKREFKTVPLVKLGTFFSKVQDFLQRFESIPDLLELDHLTVSGDVTFGKDVILKGTVIIIANHGERIDIPPRSILENKIVSGNLHIRDY